jgi:hypothetical protein
VTPENEKECVDSLRRTINGRTWLMEIARMNTFGTKEQKADAEIAYNDLIRGNPEKVKNLMTLPVKGETLGP